MTEVSRATLPPPPAHIHIIGIGGAGMSAIARVLLGRGYVVSGSDRQANAITAALARDGAIIHEGHAAPNVDGAQLVMISSAVQPDNPEVVAANAAGVPVLKRRDILGALTEGYDVIAVAGTHGKTTTTALITHLLIESGHDPTYIVGGTILNTGTNAGVGKSKWFVIEADEYDYMFLGLHPKIAVITNIEHDHPDIFPTLKDVMNAFRQFVGNIREDGLLVVCDSDQNAEIVGAERQHQIGHVAFYGRQKTMLENHVRHDLLSYCEQSGTPVDWLQGEHNQLNTIAALLVLLSAGVESLFKLNPAICTFKGTARRFEKLGETANGITIYSDYGHHPTALRATLQGARSRFPDKTIWAVWQPHTYSRTHLLAHEFAESFKDADHALITNIFAAREQPILGPTEDDIATWACESGHKDVRHSGRIDTTAAILQRETKSGDVVIIFSAGDAPEIGEMLLRGEA